MEGSVYGRGPTPKKTRNKADHSVGSIEVSMLKAALEEDEFGSLEGSEAPKESLYDMSFDFTSTRPKKRKPAFSE